MFGTVGNGLDYAMTESFWFSPQIELLDRQRCAIRPDSRTQSSTTSKFRQPPAPTLVGGPSGSSVALQPLFPAQNADIRATSDCVPISQRAFVARIADAC
ncbi:hypothetical protein C5E45_25705 [Nocardia nova]|uniref:Uncharacterized protein n=1 Tax=Nocardia nova TaxID=37330 RepID=A0A2S6AJR3_9NOCA|nr:hypothetical protein C5E45_25705 [Nocardia nova]